MEFDLFVRAGQLLRIGPWNAMARVVRALRLISGANTRLRNTPDGTVVNFTGATTFWAHPWKATLAGDTEATIRPGLINGVMPTIEGVPLDGGKDGKDVPNLKFNDVKVDAEGKGWLAAEVTCRAKDWSVESIEMVQVADLGTEDGLTLKGVTAEPPTSGGLPSLSKRRVRAPIAMLRKRKDGTLALFQNVHFNLNHRVQFVTGNTDAPRHFFYV